jgi:hypothetical protein
VFEDRSSGVQPELLTFWIASHETILACTSVQRFVPNAAPMTESKFVDMKQFNDRAAVLVIKSQILRMITSLVIRNDRSGLLAAVQPLSEHLGSFGRIGGRRDGHRASNGTVASRFWPPPAIVEEDTGEQRQQQPAARHNKAHAHVT